MQAQITITVIIVTDGQNALTIDAKEVSSRIAFNRLEAVTDHCGMASEHENRSPVLSMRMCDS